MGRVIMSGIVPLLSKPIKGTALSKLDEGAIIKINENGSPVEFYLAKHNYEPDLNGAGRELIVRKYCYGSGQNWDSYNRNTYVNSTIDTWLTNTYAGNFTDSIKTLIGTTKFYYTPGSSDMTVSTLERAFFLLSMTEFGYSNDDVGRGVNVEGITLPIAATLRIGYSIGIPKDVAVAQWTRSPKTNSTQAIWYLRSDGGTSYLKGDNDWYSRPIFTLPSTAKIDDTGLLIG